MAHASRKFHELWANHGSLVGDLDDIRICRSGEVACVDRSASDLDGNAVPMSAIRMSGQSADARGPIATRLETDIAFRAATVPAIADGGGCKACSR